MIRLLALLAAFILAVPAAAHQQKITITTMMHNPRTQMLEIVHRVPLHDAEHALQTQGMKAPDIINDIASRRAFARYIANRFSVAEEDGPIALTLLGSEVEGGNLLVYQEAHSPGRGAELLVQSQILADVWSRQENRVNAGTGADTQTAIFRAGDPAKTVLLQ